MHQERNLVAAGCHGFARLSGGLGFLLPDKENNDQDDQGYQRNREDNVEYGHVDLLTIAP
jgi:hypothetical protein